MRETHLNRRQFLRYTGSTAMVAAAPSMLSACGDDGTGSGTPSGVPTGQPSGTPSSDGLTLPDYVPYTGVTADLPATAEGIMAGFYSYPQEPVTAFSTPPGAGAGAVSMLTNMFQPVPPGAGDNEYWRELNRQIGAEIDITMTPAADYANKLSTVIASGDLPDSMLITTSLPNRAEVLTRLCADLTEFVSGSAINDYPFLANIPTDSWRLMVYGGGIYGIPIPRAIAGSIMFSRADIIRQKGLPEAPASYEEFLELARGLTDEGSNAWAFGAPKGVIYFVGNMLGQPNVWREEGGSFIAEHETEERKESIARVAELVSEGLFHPDAIGGSLDWRALFGNGTIGLHPDGYAAWDLLADTYGVEVGGIPEPAYDGGGPGVHRAGTASFGMTAFKKADAERIQQMLRIADWLAAPLGTREYMLRKFGIEGTHFTWENDLPVLTDAGNTEVKLPLEYVGDSPDVLGPAEQARVDVQRAYQEAVIPAVLHNPTVGLYSEAAINKAGELSNIINTGELDIISGRKTIDAWDDIVADWKRQGGDEMRREYEEAFAEGN